MPRALLPNRRDGLDPSLQVLDRISWLGERHKREHSSLPRISPFFVFSTVCRALLAQAMRRGGFMVR
jgi:hypothetical protein